MKFHLKVSDEKSWKIQKRMDPNMLSKTSASSWSTFEAGGSWFPDRRRRSDWRPHSLKSQKGNDPMIQWSWKRPLSKPWNNILNIYIYIYTLR